MRIVFRVDCSRQIGTGHVMRCLTLANELKYQGHQVAFVSRELDGHMCDFIVNQGHLVYSLPHVNQQNPCDVKHAHWLEADWEVDAEQTIQILNTKFSEVDWIILDHYALDQKWETRLRHYTKYIMVIDDLADRTHLCDILLDQNYYENLEKRYDNLIPKNAKQLLGPQYALLRTEFAEERKNMRKRTKCLKSILIFFGGSDPTNETYKALQALNQLNIEEFCIDVVVGQSNSNKEVIQEFCGKYANIKFHCQINYMSKLMNTADLAICAGGSTTWERYCLGLPAILIAVAYNQVEICETIGKLGIDLYIGESQTICKEDIVKAVELTKSGEFNFMQSSILASELVTGFGVTHVVSELQDLMDRNVPMIKSSKAHVLSLK